VFDRRKPLKKRWKKKIGRKILRESQEFLLSPKKTGNFPTMKGDGTTDRRGGLIATNRRRIKI